MKTTQKWFKIKLIKLIILFLPLLLISEVNADKIIVDLEISPNYQKINPGDDVIGDLALFHLDQERRVDITLESYILNDEGSFITGDQETIAIQNEVHKVIKLSTPSYLKPGDYFLEVKIKNGDEITKESERFVIAQNPNVAKQENVEERNIVFTIVLIILIIFFIIFIYNNNKLYKLVKEEHRLGLKEMLEFEGII